MTKRNGDLILQAGDRFSVTGVLPNGKRFKPIVTESWRHAQDINIVKGSRWLVRNGKRILLERV